MNIVDIESLNSLVHSKLESLGIKHPLNVQFTFDTVIDPATFKQVHRLINIYSDIEKDEFILELYGVNRLCREIEGMF